MIVVVCAARVYRSLPDASSPRVPPAQSDYQWGGRPEGVEGGNALLNQRPPSTHTAGDGSVCQLPSPEPEKLATASRGTPQASNDAAGNGRLRDVVL